MRWNKLLKVCFYFCSTERNSVLFLFREMLRNKISRVCVCAAKAFCYCPAIISHRPRSQNILKERALNPEKDSRFKIHPRSQVSLEKSSQNYKPLEKWAKPNLTQASPPPPAKSDGVYFPRVFHVVIPDPPKLSAVLTRRSGWQKSGERAGWSAVWYNSLTGW